MELHRSSRRITLPTRLPPGSTGQLHPRLHLLHPGHLRVRGSALHPGQREEVHHLRRLPVPRLPVHHDRCLHLHRPLPPGRAGRLVRPLLHPGVDLLRAHAHLLHHLLCATQEDGMRRTLEPPPPPPTGPCSSWPDRLLQLKSGFRSIFADLSCGCKSSCRRNRRVDPLRFTPGVLLSLFQIIRILFQFESWSRFFLVGV